MTTSADSLPFSIKHLVKFAVDAGRLYLAAGGPTSRIEELLEHMGRRHGVRLQIFATPTGVFVSGYGPEGQDMLTLLGRIESTGTDLFELTRIEQTIERVNNGELSLNQAERELTLTMSPLRESLVKSVSRLSLFALGSASSFLSYGEWNAAFISGILCWAVGWMSGPISKRWGWSGIFTDFIGCFFALLVSGFLSMRFNFQADSLAIGTLLLIVPGLSLTTSISELAEQNFVSGTAKMMKSVLILLAMGTAFLLTSDLAQLFFPGVNYQRWGLAEPPAFWIQVTCQCIMIGSFSGIHRAPYRYLPFTLLPGLLSWFVFNQLNDADFIVLSSFVPALTVGFISNILSRWLKVPSQIFSVPGILALVPGMLALSSFYTVTDPSGGGGNSIFFQVAIISSSIVFGLLTARVPFSVLRNEKAKI